nr:MFS transporter [Chromobacterium sp. ASV5]
MRRSLFCCFLMILLYPVGVDLYLVALPDIAAALGAGEAQLHAAFSLYLLGMASTVLAGGALADRIGRKPVVLGGALAFCLASLAAAAAGGVPALLAARAAQGVGAGALYIMTFTVLRDVLSRQRLASVLSVVNGAICVVPALAPALGYLIQSSLGWRGIFAAMACLGGLVLLAAGGLLRETRPAAAPEGEGAPLAFLAAPGFARMCALSSAGVTCILAYVGASPMILMGRLGFSAENYALAMTALALTSMAASFLNPWWIARLGSGRVLGLAHFALGAAAASLFAAEGLGPAFAPALVLAGLALVGVGFSAGFGVAMGEALAACRRRIALASAFLCVTQIASSALYIWTLGWLGAPPLAMLRYALIGAVLLYLAGLAAPRASGRCAMEER